MTGDRGRVRQAGWKEYAQGGVIGGLLVLSAYAVASNCIQIDAAPKVADYYNQYRDYRDQYNRLADWQARVDPGALAGLIPESLRGATSEVEERYRAAQGMYGQQTSGLLGVPGGHGVAAVRQQGPLTRPDWSSGVALPQNDPLLCYQIDMGADIGRMAQTGQPNRIADRCGAQGRQALANQSVRPSQDGAGVAPNTALATEATRAVLSGDYPLLDVVRGDLAWLRDNPQYHAPFRYPRAQLEIPLAEAAQHSAALQRVSAIMAGRGFAALGYEPLRQNRPELAETERAYTAATLLARLNLVYDGMARYATAYPRLAALRDTLLDFDTATIDGANEGERYGLALQLRAMEGELAMLRLESRQREERLMGALLAEYLGHQTTGLRGAQP